MKVVQINAVLTGSTGKIVKSISRMLDEKGVENYIFFADGLAKEENEIKISNRLSLKIHAFLSRLTGKQACFSKWNTRKMLKLMDKISPDVVQLHNLHHNYINLELLLKYLAKKNIKTVITLHDCWFFTGKCTHFVSAGCDRWQQECGNCLQLKKDNISWVFDRTKKLINDKKRLLLGIKNLEIVAVSKWMAGQVEKSFLSNSSTTVIHNGIDLDKYDVKGDNFREKYGLKSKKVILAMGNKWLSNENEGLLEYVSSTLGEEYAILLVGKKIENYKNVVCIDYIKDVEEMACVYRTADVFVNVTHEDSLPTVNIEALACGVPVVTYDVCGSTEIVTPLTGAIVEENNRESLVNAIKSMCMLDKEKIQKKCRKHAEENYDDKKQYLEYYKVYIGE